jgi:hypothetical protein
LSLWLLPSIIVIIVSSKSTTCRLSRRKTKGDTLYWDFRFSVNEDGPALEVRHPISWMERCNQGHDDDRCLLIHPKDIDDYDEALHGDGTVVFVGDH